MSKQCSHINSQNSRIPAKMKPEAVHEYNKFMLGVDHLDQRMSYYQYTHRTIRWWRSVFLDDRDLVIKKADKGSCIVVQDRSTYISKGSSHLADASTYKPLDSDPTASIAKNIGELVNSMKELGYLDTYTHAYMLPPEKVRTQCMYPMNPMHS